MNDQTRPSRMYIGSCSFDPARAELLGPHGEAVHLRPQSMRLLETLLAHAGQVVTREALIAAVWPGVVVTDDSLVQCVGDIRRALGSDHRLLHTVPRLGYRLDVTPAVHPLVALEPRRRGIMMWAGAGVVAILLAWLLAHDGAPTAPIWYGRGAANPPQSPTLAVRFRYDAPTDAVKEPDAAFAAGIADQLAADLARNTQLRLVTVPATAGDATIIDLARRLDAQFIVEGQVQVRATSLLLTAELIDTSNQRVLWVERSESTMARLSADREVLLRRIVKGSQASWRLADDALVLPALPQSSEVYQRVIRALARAYRFDRDEYRIARDELAQALHSEADFALGWAVRGYLDAVDASAGITGDLSDERSAERVAPAERAIALDPRLVLAHQARSLALVNSGRRADALQAAEQALRLSPFDPQGSLVLANALVANGRMADAMRAIEQAQSRYPAPPALFDFVRAKVLWGNDRFDEAVGAASRCLEKVPHFTACRAIRAVASDGMGRLEAAREDLKAYRVAVPGTPTHALGPGSYGVPKLQNDWLADIRGEIGLP